MDLRQLKNIIKEFEDSTVHKLEISEDNFTLKLEKTVYNSNNNFQTPSPSIPVAPKVASESVATLDSPEEVEYVAVKAPLVGTFYNSPSPDSSPFVRENQKVRKGDTLCIVEAMKVMNEITAPVDGTITKINVGNGDMVAYGDVLMEITE